MLDPDPDLDPCSAKYLDPDPGVKKAPDPGSGSATLLLKDFGYNKFLFFLH
jgi:hypothetical protein